MNDSSLESLFAPLVAAAPAADGAWLRRLLSDPESAKAFGAVDSELFVREGPAARAIALASATRSEGRTTMALLISVFAAALNPGKRVLLVDGDMDHGRLGEMLGLAPEADGLAELFMGRVGAAQVLNATAIPNLFLTPCAHRGSRAINFNLAMLESFLAEARERFDLVVVDSPAGGANKAALSIAKLVGHTIVVVRYSGPTREQIAGFLADLARVGSQVVGCVMNHREYVVPALFYGHR